MAKSMGLSLKPLILPANIWFDHALAEGIKRKVSQLATGEGNNSQAFVGHVERDSKNQLSGQTARVNLNNPASNYWHAHRKCPWQSAASNYGQKSRCQG